MQERKSKQGYKEQCYSHQFLNGQVSEDDRAHQWILLIENSQMSPVNAKKANWTDQYTILSRVWQYLLQGWPTSSTEDFSPYSQQRMSWASKRVAYCKDQVVVPAHGQKAAIDMLLEGHHGTSRMKTLDRSFVWWPTMDREEEEKVKQCRQCQATRHSHPRCLLIHGNGYKDLWLTYM